MLKLAFALTLVVGTTQTVPQPETCAPKEHRATAIRDARQINTAEAAAFSQLNRYQQLEQLPISPPQSDYAVQLTTDGAAYLFSIKDKTDVCHGAVFSDQNGVIYTGVPIQ
jgi:hypothetical protein